MFIAIGTKLGRVSISDEPARSEDSIPYKSSPIAQGGIYIHLFLSTIGSSRPKDDTDLTVCPLSLRRLQQTLQSVHMGDYKMVIL